MTQVSMPDAKARTVATYHAASDHFDDPALKFWDYFGHATVRRLALAQGGRVLDVCCGTGASAIPAAEAVGPAGLVTGIDLTEPLLERARGKAAARNLSHAHFIRADLEAYEPGQQFDAVICVFGIFFLPDMPAAVRRLWGWVRPRGVLAITTWGRDVLEPANTLFWEAVREIRPDLQQEFRPWDSIVEPHSVIELYRTAGISEATAEGERWEMPLATPEEFWNVVLGSGYRGTIDQLSGESLQRVRERVVRGLRARDVQALTVSAIYGSARKA